MSRKMIKNKSGLPRVSGICVRGREMGVFGRRPEILGSWLAG